MLVHRRVTPNIKFAGTHLYTWVERGTVRVKCLAYEHNAMSPARSRTRTARSGVERTNHEATAPHTEGEKEEVYNINKSEMDATSDMCLSHEMTKTYRILLMGQY